MYVLSGQVLLLYVRKLSVKLNRYLDNGNHSKSKILSWFEGAKSQPDGVHNARFSVGKDLGKAFNPLSRTECQPTRIHGGRLLVS